MRLLAVSGCASGVGKTTVTCRILERLRGWGALKTSLGRTVPAPGPYEVVVDRARLDEAGSDTALFRAAGAARVVWLRSPSDGLGPGLRDALARLSGLPGVVIEGNSWTRHVSPGYLIVVARPGVPEIKPSARSLPVPIDELAWNGPGEASPEAVRVFRPRHTTSIDASRATDPGTVELLDRVSSWARR